MNLIIAKVISVFCKEITLHNKQHTTFLYILRNKPSSVKCISQIVDKITGALLVSFLQHKWVIIF